MPADHPRDGQIRGKTLESHAGSSERSSTRRKPDSWDPLARYHSSANSFPDYGKPKEMGGQRLKQINGSVTPYSSFGLPLKSATERRTLPSRDNDHKSKRQKTDHDTSKSPYFTQAPSTQSVDLTRVEPTVERPEAIDLVSNSSTGRTVAAVTVQSYRDLSERTSLKPPRPRHSRQARDVKEVDRDSNRRITTSPDVLARDDPPPPANVKSDVSSKRLWAEVATHPPFKRPKVCSSAEPIYDGELDELAGPLVEFSGTKTRKHPDQTSKKSTNFSGLPSTRRGEIHRTVFQAENPMTSLTRPCAQPEERPWVVVTRATSGKHIFDRGQDKTLHLYHDETGAKAVLTGGGKSTDLHWMDIIWGKVNKVIHHTTQSRYVIVYSSHTAAGQAHLCLELANPTDAMGLVQWLSERTSEVHPADEQEVTGEDMPKRIFDQAWKNAVSWNAHAAPRCAPSEQITTGGAMVYATQTFRPYHGPTHDPFNISGGQPQRKLKDSMRGADGFEAPASAYEEENSLPVAINQGMETRSRRRMPQPPSSFEELKELSPDRWTVVNPNWASQWHSSLVFPATGKNRTTVDKDDITRLDDGEFLNDNLINFYFRYLQAQYEVERPEVLEKVYFFSTFFFEKLKGARGKINYDGVKAWTAKVDLLSYKYIIVPVNENAHWYLAIIYNAPQMLLDNQQEGIIEVENVDSGSSPRVTAVEREISFISLDDQPLRPKTRSETTKGLVSSSPASPDLIEFPSTSSKPRARKSMGGPQRLDPDAPRIVTLDSLGSPHSPTCRILKEYLVHEAQERKGMRLESLPGGMAPRAIPLQANYYDCGVFILGYMEEFLKDPDAAMEKLLQREDVGWDINAADIRHKVRNLLFSLQKEQVARLCQEREAKKRRLAERRARKANTAATLSAMETKQSRPKPHHDISPNDIKPSVENDETHNSPLQGARIPKSSPKQGRISPPKPYTTSQSILQAFGDSDEAPQGPAPKKHTSLTFAPIQSSFLEAHRPSIESTAPIEKRNLARFERPVEFVQPLPSSPKEASHPHVDRRHFDAVLPSIERDSPSTGPQYDGIDVSIDPTP